MGCRAWSLLWQKKDRKRGEGILEVSRKSSEDHIKIFRKLWIPEEKGGYLFDMIPHDFTRSRQKETKSNVLLQVLVVIVHSLREASSPRSSCEFDNFVR